MLYLCWFPSSKLWCRRQSCFLPTHFTAEYSCLFLGLANKPMQPAYWLEAFLPQFNTSLGYFVHTIHNTIMEWLNLSATQKRGIWFLLCCSTNSPSGVVINLLKLNVLICQIGMLINLGFFPMTVMKIKWYYICKYFVQPLAHCEPSVGFTDDNEILTKMRHRWEHYLSSIDF